MSNQLVTRMLEAVTDANTASQITYQVITGGIDDPIFVDGVSIPTLSTRIRDFLEDLLNGGDLDGDDGIGIEAISIDGNGHLLVTLTGDATPRDLGKVVPDDGIGVTNVTFNSADGSIDFELDDGRTLKLNNVAGDDGATITAARVQGANLLFDLSDGNVIDAGNISQFGGVAASSAEINEAGELVIIFSDGSTDNVGRVVGPRGANGLSTVAGYFDAAGVLRFFRNDGSQYNLGQVIVPILDASDVSVEGARIENRELVLELTNGDYTVGRIVGDDGADGTDGVSIVQLFIDDNDNKLYVEKSDGSTTAVGEVRNTVFESADVTVTNANINGDGELELDINVNGSIETRNMGTVVGENGRVFVSATLNPLTSEITFTDSEGDTLVVSGVQQNTVESATVDETTGILTITLSDGTDIVTGDIRGNDGLDGTGINNVYMVDGELFFGFEDSAISDINVGSIIAPIETNAIINTDGNLIVTMSDAQEFDLGRIRGVDGITIERMWVDDGVVYADLTDGTTDIEVGNITKNPTQANIETNGTLTIEFDDNTSITTSNRVAARDGDTITGIQYDSNTRDLIINLSTNNTNNTSSIRVPAVRGRSVENFNVDESNRTLSFDTSVPGEGPYSFSFREPVDGNSITNIEVVNGDLVIETNIDGGKSISVPVPTGDSVTSVSLDSNDNVLIEISNGSTYTLNTIEGYVGVGIDDMRFDGTDLIIELTNSETVTVPAVRGNDGQGITDITIDQSNGDLVIHNTIDDEPLRFPQLRGADADNSIIAAYFDGSDLIFDLTGGETITIPSVRGVDGETITNISFNGADLVINTSLPSPDDVITIPAVKGNDGLNGAGVDTASINSNEELVITLDDAANTTFIIPGIGSSVVDVIIDSATGQLVFEMSDGTELRSSDSVRGQDGEGTGIQSVDFTGGNLSFVLVDQDGVTTNIDAGSVAMNSVVNARIDESVNGDVGDLVFEFEDGSEITVGNVYGRDGRFVEGLRVDVEDLILEMSDGSEINSGKVTGDDGLTVTDAEVLFSGDLLITYSDGSTENAGSIGSGAGLTVWNVDNIPYVKDRVVIYDGQLFISRIDGNNDEPPSGNWIPLALGDQLIEVRAPVTISPKNSETAFSVRPTLVASPYAAIVSIDERTSRQFQVALSTDVDFNSPVYNSTDMSETADRHEISSSLNINETYIWRCRDTSVRGYTSGWSDVAEFIVPEGIIEKPSLTIDSLEDINATFNAPNFESSAYINNFDTQVHSATDWEIFNIDTNVVVFESLNDTDNLLSFTIPYGILEENTNYEIRIKHRAGSIESPWSDGLVFTTEDTFTYVDTPVIYYDGDSNSVSLFDATFNGSNFRKSERFLAVSTNVPMSHTASEWEVVNIDSSTTIENETSETQLTSYTLDTVLSNNVNYRIRVRYYNVRFGHSEWSDWLEFNAEQSISTPTISTSEDVNGFPTNGLFEVTPFDGVNETHVSTDWEVRSFFTDEIVWSSYDDTINLTQLTFDASLPDDDYKIRVRYNGNNVSSGWSNSLDFFYGTPE